MKAFWISFLMLLAWLACYPAKASEFEKPDSSSTPTISLKDFCEAAGFTDPKDMKIEWLGSPMISTNYPNAPRGGWLPDAEIGLREDGVVVWRRKPSPKAER